MSGRSAIVRAKKKGSNEGSDGQYGSHSRTYSISHQIRVVPQLSTRNDDLDSWSGSSQREPSVLEAPTYYNYGNHSKHYVQSPGIFATPPPRRHGPIVVASAIEKSDFRSHIDGLSDNFRGSIGKLVGFKQKQKPMSPPIKPPGSYKSSYERPTPPITAVPSLVHSANSDPSGRHQAYQNSVLQRSSSRHGAPLGRRDSQSSAQTDIQIFSGTGADRSWRTMPNRPEALSSTVDTLVLLYAPSQASRPLASFYVNSQKLRDAGSTRFINLLEDRLGPRSGRFSVMNTHYDEEVIASEVNSDNGAEFRDTPSVSAPLSDYNIDMVEYYREHPDQRRYHRSSNIKYELYIDCPPGEDGGDATSWLLTTRNFFAILHDFDALCGTTLFEALAKVVHRLYNTTGYLSEDTDKREFILDFLQRHKYQDVRNSFPHALSLLAFSELPEIQWKEGYIEAFAHCTGMRHLGVIQTPEWHHVSACTHILLHSASADMNRRLRRAQKSFADLDFGEMWSQNIPSRSCGRASYARFRQWIYTYILERDPELQYAMNDGSLWLTPQRTQMLKDMFHSLFDYLVDRDVIFDGSGCRPGEAWNIVNNSGQFFRPNPSSEIPITAMLNSFDNNNGFPHMPHPYPLVPPSVPPQKSRILSRRPSNGMDEEQMERKASTYTEASNLYQLGTSSNLDSVIADFNAFEQEDDIRNIDPRDGRLGRWIFVYGALQVLATIETSTPGLQYTQNVPYHLSVPMRGIPPWVQQNSKPEPGPAHEMSHAFTVPATWPAALPRARVNSYKPIMWNEFGDGRIRVDHDITIYRPATQHDEELPKSGESLSSSPSLPTLRQKSSGLDRSGAMPRTGGRGGLGGVGPEVEDPVARARKDAALKARRAQVHGFSNYKPEPGW